MEADLLPAITNNLPPIRTLTPLIYEVPIMFSTAHGECGGTHHGGGHFIVVFAGFNQQDLDVWERFSQTAG